MLMSLMHWGLVPQWMQGGGANKELWNYQLYLVAGGVVAWHYEQFHGWLHRHWRSVIVTTVLAAVVAEGWYFLADSGAVSGFSGDSASEPFQPVVVPFYLGLIASLYLLGVATTHPRLPGRLRHWLQSAGTNSYGIFLSQILFVTLLAVAGWGQLEARVSWPLVVIGAVVFVYLAGCALTSMLARLPGARGTAGRPRTVPRPITGPASDS